MEHSELLIIPENLREALETPQLDGARAVFNIGSANLKTQAA